MTKEGQLIERVSRKFHVTAAGLRTGIGDDAAVIVPARPGTRDEWVVTTDAFLENVHFLRLGHPPGAVGYKALARATSDLAAMGARPRFFLLTLAIPESCTGKWLDHCLDGMARAARKFGLTLVGGDTTKCPTIMLNLTVLGEVKPGRAILRSGARPGDLVCISGKPGEAGLGLQLVLKRLHRNKEWKKLTRKHFYPEPRLALGQWLAKRGVATSMIDTSDGLSTDLGHICEASGVGARIFAGEIPLVRVPAKLHGLGLDPLRLALDAGEDYELLFTVPKKFARRLPRKVGSLPLTIIGEIVRGKGITLVSTSGGSAALRPGGWDPFR